LRPSNHDIVCGVKTRPGPKRDHWSWIRCQTQTSNVRTAFPEIQQIPTPRYLKSAFDRHTLKDQSQWSAVPELLHKLIKCLNRLGQLLKHRP
jgi:hypothetical protein